MAKKMHKKTRNVISGLLVGFASVFAVINFVDMPADEVRDFIISTVLFFVIIVLLALLAVSTFKALGWLKGKLRGSGDDGQDQDNGEKE